MSGLWPKVEQQKERVKAYYIFNEAETQPVIPPPARPNYNGDPKK